MIRPEWTPTPNTHPVQRPVLGLAVGDQEEEVLSMLLKSPQKNCSLAFSTEGLEEWVVVARSMGHLV